MDLDPEANYYQEREAELLAARDAKIAQLTEEIAAKDAENERLRAAAAEHDGAAIVNRNAVSLATEARDAARRERDEARSILRDWFDACGRYLNELVAAREALTAKDAEIAELRHSLDQAYLACGEHQEAMTRLDIEIAELRAIAEGLLVRLETPGYPWHAGQMAEFRARLEKARKR